MTKKGYNSPEEITRIGEEFYFETLKNELEPEYNGQFVIIDVDTKKYIINPDKLRAIEEAQKKFGNKILFIIQVGNVQRPSTNFKEVKYAWEF